MYSTAVPHSSPFARGYFVRMKAIDLVVSTFICEIVSSSCKAQIVSLGAGFDTLYFRNKKVICSSGLTVYEVS